MGSVPCSADRTEATGRIDNQIVNFSSLRALMRPTARSLPWAVPAAAAGLALGVVAAAIMRRAPDAFEGVHLIRRAGLFVVAGLPVLMDDSAAPTIAASPVPLRVRRGMRLAMAVCAAIAGWTAVTMLVSLRMTGSLPLWWLLFETLTTLAVGVAVALVATARWGSGGPAGAVALVVLSFLMPLIPTRFSLTTGMPGDGAWAAAHARWAVVLVASCAVIALLCMDPARRRRWRWLWTG